MTYSSDIRTNIQVIIRHILIGCIHVSNALLNGQQMRYLLHEYTPKPVSLKMQYIYKLLLEMQTVESGSYNNGHNRLFCELTPHGREGGMTPLHSFSVRLMKLPPSGKTTDCCNIHRGLRAYTLCYEPEASKAHRNQFLLSNRFYYIHSVSNDSKKI